jgi:hypothetical protein
MYRDQPVIICRASAELRRYDAEPVICRTRAWSRITRALEPRHDSLIVCGQSAAKDPSANLSAHLKTPERALATTLRLEDRLAPCCLVPALPTPFHGALHVTGCEPQIGRVRCQGVLAQRSPRSYQAYRDAAQSSVWRSRHNNPRARFRLRADAHSSGQDCQQPRRREFCRPGGVGT